LTLIDIRLYRLPNALTYGSGIAVLTIALVQTFVTRDWGQLSVALISGLIPALMLFLIAVFSRGGMGLGDVKLSLVLGLAAGLFGAKAALTVFVVAFLIGGLYAVGILSPKKLRQERNSFRSVPAGRILDYLPRREFCSKCSAVTMGFLDPKIHPKFMFG